MKMVYSTLTLSRPGRGGGGLLEHAPTLKIRNFQPALKL